MYLFIYLLCIILFVYLFIYLFIYSHNAYQISNMSELYGAFIQMIILKSSLQASIKSAVESFR